MASVGHNMNHVLRFGIHHILLFFVLRRTNTNAFTPSEASTFPRPPTNPSRTHQTAPIEPEIVSGPLPFLSRTTARESAVVVEWERMTELERRIEDGHRYEHDPDVNRPWSSSGSRSNSGSAQPRETARRQNSGNRGSTSEAVPCHRAIFCGYRTTADEYGRLRSARPADDL
jgi:hypothetical protein